MELRIEDATLFALVVGESKGGVDCFLWRLVDELSGLPKPLQFEGLSSGSGFSGTTVVVERVLSDQRMTVSADDIVGSVWPCSALMFSSGAVLLPSLSICVDLKPGPYVLLLATYAPGLEGNFGITLVSNHPCELDQLWPPKWRK